VKEKRDKRRGKPQAFLMRLPKKNFHNAGELREKKREKLNGTAE